MAPSKLSKSAKSANSTTAPQTSTKVNSIRITKRAPKQILSDSTLAMMPGHQFQLVGHPQRFQHARHNDHEQKVRQIFEKLASISALLKNTSSSLDELDKDLDTSYSAMDERIDNLTTKLEELGGNTSNTYTLRSPTCRSTTSRSITSRTTRSRYACSQEPELPDLVNAIAQDIDMTYTDLSSLSTSGTVSSSQEPDLIDFVDLTASDSDDGFIDINTYFQSDNPSYDAFQMAPATKPKISQLS
ncbi:MAG: hypothetical protein MMC33_004862 [Icmadophila ericetorum]|nr:hypothetical protein [Icmadophila ericetorum]